MRFDRRYGNEIDPDQSLLELLAARYDLSEQRARDVLERARRDAAGDEYRRPVETWVAILMREARVPAPGKRTRVMGGRRSMVGAGESVDVVPGRWTRTHAEAIRLEERRAFLAKMRAAYGPQVDGVEIHEGSREVPAGRKALARGGQIHVESGVDLDGAHGEQVIAHELAHVAQQTWRGGGWDDGPPSRGALEADAHGAAEQAIAGRTADVRLAAPAAMALGYSEGEDKAPARAGGGQPAGGGGGGGAPAPAAKASTARGAPPAPRAAAPAPASAESPRAARGTETPAAAGGGDGKRGRGADGVLLPEAATGLSAPNQQRLGQVDARNQSAGALTAALPSAQHSTDGARAAVEEPTAEQDARAQHGVVTEVDKRPPPSPEIEAACTRIREVIKNKRPPSEDKLVEAKPREMAAEAGAQMDAGVESRTDGVRQEYADVQESPKGQPSREPVPVQLPPSKVETPAVDAGAGAPEPSAPEETSLDDDVAAQEQKLDDAGMNTEPAKLVQDGPIGDARGGVGELKGMAKTDPAKVRLEQGKAIARAQADMRNLQAAADKALADARAGTVTGVGAKSKEIKGSEEQQRARAGQEMQAIFQRTQKTVDGLLTPLARTALAKWQAGVDRLSTEFEGRLAHVKAKIEERYKSEDNGNPLDELGAMWNKGTDAVFGLPDWVVAAYDAAEGAFASGCMDLLRDVSRDVNDVIEKCKQLIQQARKDIDAIVDKLPASLQSWARGEADRLGKQLDKLDQKVADTQKNINKDLVQRAFGAVQDVRQRVHELREAAKGLIGKIADAVGAFLANPAKAIVDGLLRVLGIPPESFWAMVGRLGDVIGAIAKEPLRFANTLIQGVAQGFGRFFDKFPQHIGESIFGWIFGTLGAAGVSMPSDFSGPGILASMLGMFGIDGGLVTSMVGEGLSPEELAEAQGELGAVSGGPMAIVELLREHLDPGAMMAMIKQAAIEFLLTAIITRVAMRIVMLFNPAGAILQAIEAILRVMVWVVTNAARIFTLIETLVAGAGHIIAGNVAGAAALVESALVQIIVPVIDFLAGYLGLGGLPGKIREIIMKLRGKVEAALKKVTGAISVRARAKAKAKREQEKKKPAAKEPAKEAPRGDDKDRDPARRDDDEENDPRKGKDRPDENDPRRANRRDDEDEDGPDRKRRKDEDDDGPDGKRRKDGDDDDGPNRKRRKDDDDDGNDLAAARRAARQAADRGWAAARTASARELLARGELEAVLRRADQPIGRAKIDLDVEERGRVWAVEAQARVGTARARDSEGSGWIARNEAGGSFYAADDHSAFNRQLIDDAFKDLKREDRDDDAVSLRGAYDEKTEDGRRVEREQQAKLDQRIRGVRFELTLEAFAGAEKDEKIETKARVTPNDSDGTTQLDIKDKFPFVVGDARPGLGSRMLDAVKQQIAPFKSIPMLEGERAVPGYVVNIAATGGEAKKSPGMAVRYFGDAWAGSDRAAEATNRTAVVIGVNGYQHVDPDLTTKSEGDIEAAVRAVSTDHKNANITIFGWMWDLPWERVGGGAVDHDTVRAAFLKLKTEEERKAVRAVNEAWKTDGTVQWTLPYGEFRNKVTDSSYTSDAVHRLGAVADPVHILLQDGDGGVKAAGADGAGLRGVFTEYDEFLSRLAQHRLLTIGGYRFTGFDWDAEPDATPKTRQLTELGNAIDHAIRSAIATVYPEMLYPTEPNLLIKALDEQHEDGSMNVRPGAEGGRMVPPGMFEHRAVEGWRAGHTVRNAQPDHPHKVAWAPQAALTTSPVPDKPSRGLTVYDYDASEEVNAGGDGVATMANQAQTYLNPETMALWYGRSIGNGKMNVSADMKAMFQQVTAAASTRLGEMGAPADPDADYHAGLSQAHAQATANARRASRQQPRQQREAWLRQRQERLDQIHRIVHAIITTLVSGDLDTIWRELKQTFDGFLENPVPRPVADDAEADDAAADASPAAGPAPENGA